MEPYRSVPDNSHDNNNNVNHSVNNEHDGSSYFTQQQQQQQQLYSDTTTTTNTASPEAPVNSAQYYQYADYPQVVPHEYSQKEAIYHQHASEVYPEAVLVPTTNKSPGPLPGYAELDNSPQCALDGAPPGAQRAATICGLRRSKFWIVVGVAVLVVVGAVVGGVAGSMTANKGSQPDNTSSSGGGSSSSNSSVTVSTIPAALAGSKIAASNWTGPDSFGRRAVFFQDEYNSVIARLWDSQNDTWLTHNVSDILQTRHIDLNIASGKTLASAALDTVGAYGPRLWYVDPTNVVQTFYNANLNPKQDPDGWTMLPPGPSNHQIWPNSQIAGAWQRCYPNCVGDWILAYQRASDGTIMTANHSNWNNPDEIMDPSAISKSTALAIVPWYQAVVNKMGLISETKQAAGQTGSMQLWEFNGSNWAGTGGPIVQDIIPSAASETQFAITKWDDWRQTLYMSLTSDGKVAADAYKNGTHTQVPAMLFTGHDAVSSGSRKFTAITLTLDAMFYGVVDDGTVLEYALDRDDPQTFKYVSTLWPPAEDEE